MILSQDQRDQIEHHFSGYYDGRPFYYLYDRSGLMRECVGAYLNNQRPLSEDEIFLMRAYLLHWIQAPMMFVETDFIREVEAVETEEELRDAYETAFSSFSIDPI